MPSIPLGIEAYNRPSGFQPEVRLLNMYLEEDKSGASPDKFYRLQRPGLAIYATLPAVARGLYRKDGVLGGAPIAASGNKLYRIDGSLVTEIGTITSSLETIHIS